MIARTLTMTGWHGLRLTAGLLLILAGLALSLSSHGQDPDAASAAQPGPVYQVDIDGPINPGTLGRLQHGIAMAEAAQAQALIVRIDTPGGLLSSTRDMVSAITEAQLPIIGYVGPAGASATSAGAFILLASHLAVMESGTNLGASSPIGGDGSDIEGTLGKKIMNDSKAFMRAIASRQGRNAEVAERFVSEALSLSAAEARAQNVVDLVVSGAQGLLPALDGRQVEFQGQPRTLALTGLDVKTVEPRLVDRLLQYIAQPQIAHLLVSLGMLAIFIEILSPGLALPGIVGAIALILGFVGIQALPTNSGFLILLLLGMALMFAEYFVAGFGVLGIGGAIAFILGSLNLFEGIPTDDYQGSIVAVSVAVSAAFLLASFLIARSFSFGTKKPQAMAGKSGEAMVSFDSEGYVLVEDQRWAADTLEPLHHGDAVTVVKIQKPGRLLVRKARP